MKKAVLLVAALLVCSSFAFAEINVGAWGRGFFVPAVSAGEDVLAINQASWWSSPPRIGFTISGTSDNVGVQLDFNADGIFQPGTTEFDVTDTGSGVAETITIDNQARLTPGDQQKIWVKLFDMLTIQIGNIYDDTLRGNAVLPAWDWVRFLGMNGEDLIFSRIGINGTADTVVSLAPVEGLYIAAALYGLNDGYALLEDVFKNGQYAAGYTIADIGMIRLQYIGAGDEGTIEAAFKLTAIPGLIVDVGGDIPTDSDVAGYDAEIDLFASYAMDALTLMLEGSVRLNTVGDPAMEVGVGATYGLDGGISLAGEVMYQNDVKSGFVDGQIAFLLGVTMGFSNGLVGIGIEGSTGDLVGQVKNATTPAADADAFVWGIPIRLEYWF